MLVKLFTFKQPLARELRTAVTGHQGVRVSGMRTEARLDFHGKEQGNSETGQKSLFMCFNWRLHFTFFLMNSLSGHTITKITRSNFHSPFVFSWSSYTNEKKILTAPQKHFQIGCD